MQSHIPPSQLSYYGGSLITHQIKESRLNRFCTSLDIFAFLPVPKDRPVSTTRSIAGSIIFLLVFLAYLGVDFYSFVMNNPPSVEQYEVKLDDEFYELPHVAVAFMTSEYLNQTDTYERYLNYTFTRELKSFSLKLEEEIPYSVNNRSEVDWITEDIFDYYKLLRSPSEPIYAKGLLYASDTCNYTKISISMCDLNNASYNCANLSQIKSFTAKGRVFLFMEDPPNNMSISRQNADNTNKYQLANFFLQPLEYKRVIIRFRVVKTEIYPDYFNRFKTEYHTRLVLHDMVELSSNTAINDEEEDRISIHMMGILLQLAPEVQVVRISYLTLIDYVAKWGAFANVLFTVFALVLLRHNRQKFYHKNPQWDEFRLVLRKQVRQAQQAQQDTREYLPAP